MIRGPQLITEVCQSYNFYMQLPQDIQQEPIRHAYRLPGFDGVGEDLLNRLLDVNCRTRISVEAAIQHPFFDSVRHEHFSRKK